MMAGQAQGLEQHLAAHPSSPLFARLANALLKTGEVTRAVELCERGVRTHPGYTTGHLVYARCLAARGNFESASDTLARMVGTYPGNIILEQLQEEWAERLPRTEMSSDETSLYEPPAEEARIREEAPLAEDTGFTEEAFLEDAPFTEETASEDAPSTEETPAEVETGPEGDTFTGEALPGPTAMEGLDHSTPETEPASALLPEPKDTDVAIPATPVPDDAVLFLGGEPHAAPPMQSATGFVERDRIISRTLAEIYASQGATREAVETYHLLIERMPDKRELFEGRVRELEERLRSGPDAPRTARE
jgi:tetratricopeptide (TPR) repeat protein